MNLGLRMLLHGPCSLFCWTESGETKKKKRCQEQQAQINDDSAAEHKLKVFFLLLLFSSILHVYSLFMKAFFFLSFALSMMSSSPMTGQIQKCNFCTSILPCLNCSALSCRFNKVQYQQH